VQGTFEDATKKWTERKPWPISAVLQGTTESLPVASVRSHEPQGGCTADEWESLSKEQVHARI
jgi:hypothetical protein